MQQRTKIAVAVAVALQSMVSIAQAQEAPQRVEITGSRIRQVDLETSQPIQVMTQEQIQKTGLVTVGDIIANMSSAGSPAFSKGGSLTSNRENGGQYANLRNLGSQRLLVLVNGKRWTQTVAGLTDMSTIPSSMIERMEILKDGASSIYGSDAIAGVVNIILKKSMEGGQLSMYAGRNGDVADGRNKDFSLTYGAGNEKASLMFGLSHTEAGAVWSRDRDFTSYSRTSEFPLEGLGGGPWGRIRQVSASGGATGFDKILNHTGDQNNPGVGQDSRNPLSYHDVVGAPVAADNFNTTRSMVFAMPSKLDTIFTKGELQLPYDMRLTTTAMYASRKGVS
ncbi:MAG: TonB-dependent receptor plug domain-containing protein, partial [Telluria sp.]